jgi:predicted GNAT family acetyltransferase
MKQRIYQLQRVVPPRPAPGRMRVATSDDLELLANWFQAFVLESQPEGHDKSIERARENARYWIDSGGLRVWENGRPVSMAGAGGPTPHGIRISAVYTPPADRRRGYASALVAALSQAQLDQGRRFCFLYTDLSNPTSNKIYQDIGYEPVSDAEDWQFVAH